MSNDRYDDKHVSAAYKELARERTPEHLDQKILATAASAARKPAYSRWMAWSRPAAWAATITLCLAITLELLRDPAMDVSIDAASPAAIPALENKRDSDAAVDEDLADANAPMSETFRPQNRELAKDQQPAKEEIGLSMKPADIERQQELAESMADSAASDKTALARSASKQSFNEPAPVAAEPEADAKDAVVSQSAAPSIEEVSLPMDAATAPTRSRTEEAQAVSGMARFDAFEADNSACSAEARTNASDWFNCITQLEADGLEDAAASERQLLIDTFPDFKLP